MYLTTSFPSIKPRYFDNQSNSRIASRTSLATYFPTIQTKDNYLQQSVSAILPDISRRLVHVHGYMSRDMTMDDIQLIEWITCAREYVDTFCRDFDNVCNRQLRTLQIIKTSADYVSKFQIGNVDRLPEDCVLYIYSYLHPCVKLMIHMSKYSEDDIDAMLLKMYLKHLRGILKAARHRFYDLFQLMEWTYRSEIPCQFTAIEQKRMLKNMERLRPYVYVSAPNKLVAISRIRTMLHQLVALSMDCSTHYLAYQLVYQALQLMNSIIYIGKKYM